MCENGGTSQRLCNDNKCNICLNKSFACHEKMQYWSLKNSLKPRQVFKGSNNIFIFDCNSCNHEFSSKLCKISGESIWCSYCSSQKMCMNDNCKFCFEKSFASNPKSKYWSKKNEKIPKDFFKSSCQDAYFDCPDCKHEFKTRIGNLIDGWCIYCAGKKLCDNNECKFCLKKSFAFVPFSIYWSNKNECKPRDIHITTSKKYKFECPSCKEIYEKAPSKIVENSYICGKNECAKKNAIEILKIKKDSKFNNEEDNQINKIEFLNINEKSSSINKEKITRINTNIPVERSFASHEKAKYWSKKNTICPELVFQNSHTKYLFDCDKCKHIFEKSPNKIITENSWCQYCAHQLLCDNDDCEHCFDNCFESHPKAKFWSKKNTKHPGDVFKKSGSKYWFDCHKCGHDYEKILCDMDRYDCPYCGSQQLCTKDCQTCFNKSFASSDKVKYLDPENNIDPRTIFKASEKKYDFICDKNHKFSAALNKITCDNTWCPNCINKTETKLYDWLVERYSNVEKQKRFDWCKNKKGLPFDFYLPDLNLLIELDGNQHFEQIQNWQSPEKTKETDIFKNDKALENGFSIIRIMQSDVWSNTNDWSIKLIENIKKYEIPIQVNIGDKY
jgi:very-short-patch-repair endonuclease